MPKNPEEKVITSAIIRRRGRDIVKSAGRSLELLELFRDVRRPLRMSEIAKMLSLPQSSASVLIRSMVSMGYIVRIDRKFVPSVRVTLLANWLNDAAFRHGNLTSLIQEIESQTGDTVILAARNGIYVEVLAVERGRMDTLYHTRPGEARVLTRALMGQMILSAMTRTEAERLVNRVNSEQTRADRRVSFSKLVPILDNIRQTGFGYSENTMPGASNLAMLLPAVPHGERLVIGNASTTDRIRNRRKQIADIMNAAISKYFR